MPLSDFLEKFNPNEKASSAEEVFLCLTIGDKKIKSGIWNSSDKKSVDQGNRVLSFGSTENWSGESPEELIVVADTSIASAVSKLPEAIQEQPTKTVLGLPETWIEGDSIKTHKLALLEKVCKKLLLKPQGFVITAEAIAHFLKKEEGGLPSVILASLEESEIAVSLIVGGKFLGTKSVGRSENLALDIEEGLLRFDFKDALPSRILLVDGGEDLEEARQSLISYPWVGPEVEKKLRFVQLPKVEIAPANLEVSAVVAASSREFAPALSREPKFKLKVEEVAEEVIEKPETKEDLVIQDQFTTADNFGFQEELDVAQKPTVVQDSVQEEEVSEVSVVSPEPLVEEEKKNLSPIPKAASLGNLKSFLTFPPLFISRIFSFFRSLSFAFLPKKAIFIVSILLLVFLLVGVGMFSFTKAEVKITVKPQKIEQEFEFTVSSKISQIDLEKMILPAREVVVEVSGNKTSTVNGKKTIGEKANGEVVVFNRSDQAKTLPKNTILKGPSGTKFLTLEEKKIASKSADLEKGIDKWGEATVKVTAVEIGTQYNLSANSTIVVAADIPSSVLLVKNNTAFSGGSSREIQAVTKSDKEGLQKSLISELEAKAREEIKGKIDPGDQLLSDSLILKNKVDQFDHELDEEAATLSLEEKVQYSAFYFQKTDFTLLAGKIISSLISSGYEKNAIKESETFELKDKNKGIYQAKVYQEHLPFIEIDKIRNDLKLKTFVKAEEYLMALGKISGVTITIRPDFFSKIKTLPLSSRNINLVIEPI